MFHVKLDRLSQGTLCDKLEAVDKPTNCPITRLHFQGNNNYSVNYFDGFRYKNQVLREVVFNMSISNSNISLISTPNELLYASEFKYNIKGRRGIESILSDKDLYIEYFMDHNEGNQMPKLQVQSIFTNQGRVIKFIYKEKLRTAIKREKKEETNTKLEEIMSQYRKAGSLSLEEVKEIIKKLYEARNNGKIINSGRRRSSILNIYLGELRSKPEYMALTLEEEKRLIWPLLNSKEKQYNKEARIMLVNHNLLFAYSEAKNFMYKVRNIHDNNLLLDLNYYAYEGLNEAAKRFDPTKDNKFISFAVWWIKQRLYSGYNEKHRVVRLPINKLQEMFYLNVILNNFMKQYKRRPYSEAEILEFVKTNSLKTEISEKDIKNMLHTITGPSIIISIDKNLSEKQEIMGHRKERTLKNLLQQPKDYSPEYELEKESLNIEIERALGTLSKREAEIIQLYFGLNIENRLTLKELSKLFGLSREGVRQIKERALRKLRYNSNSKELKAYLG